MGGIKKPPLASGTSSLPTLTNVYTVYTTELPLQEVS
jgi:hypothetical protein